MEIEDVLVVLRGRGLGSFDEVEFMEFYCGLSVVGRRVLLGCLLDLMGL